MDSNIDFYKLRIEERYASVVKLYKSLDKLDERLCNLEAEKGRLREQKNKLDFDESELTIELEALYLLEEQLQVKKDDPIPVLFPNAITLEKELN